MIDRRKFMQTAAAGGLMLTGRTASYAKSELPDNKHLASILNNDINNMLVSSSGAQMTAEEYRRAVRGLIEPRPGVLAQNVGLPDPVIYRSSVATPFEKYLGEISRKTWPNDKASADAADLQADAMRSLAKEGTDPLALTIEECHKAAVFVVASYRMNAEDWYNNTWMLSDIGRDHPDSRIPGTGALDPADPVVFEHRAQIFREVVEKYDVDGIEFDYMRWTHMISHPLKNHPMLTREVRETRRMLDETARRKGRKRLLLGARVGYSLAGPPAGKSDFSCKDLGLDVSTWIAEKSVDYLCPSYFWPRLPGLPRTVEFVALGRNSKTGIYPTVFPFAKWQDDRKQTYIGLDDVAKMAKLKHEMCDAALEAYHDGADGISTFNWVHHQQPEIVHKPMREDWGPGSKKVQMEVHSILGSPEKLRACLKQGA